MRFGANLLPEETWLSPSKEKFLPTKSATTTCYLTMKNLCRSLKNMDAFRLAEQVLTYVDVVSRVPSVSPHAQKETWPLNKVDKKGVQSFFQDNHSHREFLKRLIVSFWPKKDWQQLYRRCGTRLQVSIATGAFPFANYIKVVPHNRETTTIS